MPCNYKEYDENWKLISNQIKLDAGNKCELCFAPNGALIQRIKGAEYSWYKIENAQFGDHYTKVILTVHHIDHDKKNNTKYNLIALCQRCHLRLDTAVHIKNRKITKSRKDDITPAYGDSDLPFIPCWKGSRSYSYDFERGYDIGILDKN